MNKRKEETIDDLGDIFNMGAFDEASKEYNRNAEPAFKQTPTFEDEGFKCLGYRDDQNYIWSNFKQSLFVLKSADLNLNNFLNILGDDYLSANYPKFSIKYEIIGVDTRKLAGDIIRGCKKAGIFNVNTKFGFGIFEDPLDKDYLIINGEEIWGTNPKFKNDRVQGKNIFTNIKDLGFPKTTQQSTIAEAQEWLDLLKTWKYKRSAFDALLVFGWIFSAPFAGCLKWRAHFSLTGDAGTGKSTLQTCIKNAQGEFALLFDGQSSEAGIRQKVGSSSCVVLIDESEANSQKIASTLNFFRTASSSGIVARGTSDQEGMDFILKVSGMIGGIVPPNLGPADISRFLRIELDSKGDVVSDLLFDDERQQELGRKLLMSIIMNYKEFKQVMKEVRAQLLKDNDVSRYADNYTAILSTSYYLLNKDFDKEKIAKFVSQIDLEKEKNSMQEKEHDILLSHILKSEIRSNGGTYSVVEWRNKLNSQDIELGKEAKETLARYGIKVSLNTMYIASKDANFRKLLKNTKFESGDILSVLSRLQGATVCEGSMMIGGIRSPRNSVIAIVLNKHQDFNND